MIDTDKYEGHSIEYSYEIVSVDDDKEMDATYALLNDAPLLLAEVKRLREIIQVQIVTPRSKDFFFQHYGKDEFEERWKEWVDGIQDRVWGRKND